MRVENFTDKILLDYAASPSKEFGCSKTKLK